MFFTPHFIMASCDPSECVFCIKASGIQYIALRRLEHAKKTKSHHYSFWVTHASAILMSHYNKHKALCKEKLFQDVLKLVANCFNEDYDDLLRDAADVNETCCLVYCFNRIAQLVEDTSDDETLKEMFCCMTDDDDEVSEKDGEKTDEKAQSMKAETLTSSIDTSSLQMSGEPTKDSVGTDPDRETSDSSAAFLKSDAVYSKTSDETSEMLRNDFDLWCSTATREELIKRLRELSFK